MNGSCSCKSNLRAYNVGLFSLFNVKRSRMPLSSNCGSSHVDAEGFSNLKQIMRGGSRSSISPSSNSSVPPSAEAVFLLPPLLRTLALPVLSLLSSIVSLPLSYLSPQQVALFLLSPCPLSLALLPFLVVAHPPPPQIFEVVHLPLSLSFSWVSQDCLNPAGPEVLSWGQTTMKWHFMKQSHSARFCTSIEACLR